RASVAVRHPAPQGPHHPPSWSAVGEPAALLPPAVVGDLLHLRGGGHLLPVAATAAQADRAGPRRRGRPPPGPEARRRRPEPADQPGPGGEQGSGLCARRVAGTAATRPPPASISATMTGPGAFDPPPIFSGLSTRENPAMIGRALTLLANLGDKELEDDLA